MIIRQFVCSVVAVICCVACATLYADISVPNFSFENPDVADNGAFASVPSWTFGTGGGFSAAAAGIHDQLDLQYPGATGDNSPLPGTADGGQNAFISISPGISASFGSLMVSNLDTIQSATEYSLTVALGNRLDADPGDTILSLTADGISFASLAVAPAAIPNGTFSDFLLTFTTLAIGDPLVGASLGIELRMDAPGSGPVLQGNFDNIRLESNAIPEPSSGILVLMGAMAAIFRRRKVR